MTVFTPPLRQPYAAFGGLNLLLPTKMFSLVILTTAWILVSAADSQQSKIYTRYENGGQVVKDLTVFQCPAASTLHCATLCQQQETCEAFTFSQKLCSGHRIVWTSSAGNQSADRTRLYVKKGPCSDYRVLDDVRRDVNNVGETLCDDNLTLGWYRFLLDGADAVMPTACVEVNRCGTSSPYWLDLQGGELPAVGQETVARASAQYSWSCEWYRTPITVRNCGAFYLYLIEPPGGCNLAYCAERVNK